jgi:SHS family lactate transporter-like MFS transporter
MSGYAGKAAKWWKEPTKDQWYAFGAAWMGWTLDAFDFSVFLLIMAPIAQEFGVPLIDVTAVFSVTLVMCLGGPVRVAEDRGGACWRRWRDLHFP